MPVALQNKSVFTEKLSKLAHFYAIVKLLYNNIHPPGCHEYNLLHLDAIIHYVYKCAACAIELLHTPSA